MTVALPAEPNRTTPSDAAAAAVELNTGSVSGVSSVPPNYSTVIAMDRNVASSGGGPPPPSYQEAAAEATIST